MRRRPPGAERHSRSVALISRLDQVYFHVSLCIHGKDGNHCPAKSQQRITQKHEQSRGFLKLSRVWDHCVDSGVGEGKEGVLSTLVCISVSS